MGPWVHLPYLPHKLIIVHRFIYHLQPNIRCTNEHERSTTMKQQFELWHNQPLFIFPLDRLSYAWSPSSLYTLQRAHSMRHQWKFIRCLNTKKGEKEKGTWHKILYQPEMKMRKKYDKWLMRFITMRYECVNHGFIIHNQHHRFIHVSSCRIAMNLVQKYSTKSNLTLINWNFIARKSFTVVWKKL